MLWLLECVGRKWSKGLLYYTIIVNTNGWPSLVSWYQRWPDLIGSRFYCRTKKSIWFVEASCLISQSVVLPILPCSLVYTLLATRLASYFRYLHLVSRVWARFWKYQIHRIVVLALSYAKLGEHGGQYFPLKPRCCGFWSALAGRSKGLLYYSIVNPNGWPSLVSRYQRWPDLIGSRFYCRTEISIGFV